MRIFFCSISFSLLLIVNFASAAELTLMSGAKGDSLYIGTSDTFNTNNYNIDISGNIINYGTFNAGSSEIQCGGNWTNSSPFNGGTSTVVFDGSNQTISGSTTFYGLKKNVSATDTLYFDKNSTQTITGSLDLQGADGNLLNLRSTQDGDTFGLIYSGEDSRLTLSYLNVKDSDATGGKTLAAMHSVDAGNNSNWSFVATDIITANIRAWLEGPYNVGSHSMITTLRNNSLIPNQSPYAADPISVTSIPSNVTDWVLVELRETADGVAVKSKSMFLESDGDIIDTTGSAPEFSNLSTGNYFVVVRHRNHLAIMSKLAHTFVAKGGTLETLDLRNSVNVYGENSVKELETGVWGLYTGDANGNGQIQTNDKNDYWRLQVGMSGYKNSDFNLNGEVQTSDKNDYWRSNVGRGTQVP